MINKKSIKYGSNALILIAAVVAIVVVLNLLVSPDILKKLIGKDTLKWDLTPTKIYTLDETSVKILNDLQKDVVIYAMFEENKAKEISEFLNKYIKYQKIKIVYEDPDKPGVISKLDPDGSKKVESGSIVVTSGNKMKVIGQQDLISQGGAQGQEANWTGEQAVTGAIKYVTSDKSPTVYFTEGHEEKKVETNYNILKNVLQNNAYEVKTINLYTTEKVPEDAEYLIMMSPKSDINAVEKDKMSEFMKNGGKMLVLMDYIEKDTSFTKLEEFLASYNISFNYDKVKESNERANPKNPYEFISTPESNDVNSGFKGQKVQIIMSNSRSINVLNNNKEGLTVYSLMKTSKGAKGEIVDKTKGKDINGPLDLVVATENKNQLKPSKIAVYGNSGFIEDPAINSNPNGLVFFLNSVSWMMDKKDDVIIAPKSLDARKITVSSKQVDIMNILLIIVLPILILVSGMVVWMRRKHL